MSRSAAASTMKSLTLKNGDKYEGGFNDQSQTMEGRGCYTFASGTKYVGDFSGSMFEGAGDLQTSQFRIRGLFKQNTACGDDCIVEYAANSGGGNSGDRYQGGLNNNKRNGRGRLIFGEQSECLSFEGQFVDDLFEGTGVLTFRNPAGMKYEGEFVAGLFHGQGTLLHPNYTYSGQFAHSKKHGRGEITYTQTNENYKGEFSNDKKSGRGEYIYADGSRYTGMFKDDKKHGANGEFISGSMSYTGDFQHGRFEGVGKLRNMKDKYTIEGTFMNNAAEGECKLTHFTSENLDDPCPSYFQGTFFHNSKHGQCKFVLNDAKNVRERGKFTGQFIHNIEKLASSDYGKRF